jgi:murein endopeptidase
VIWVIEEWNKQKQKWLPCEDMSLLKSDALYNKKTWVYANPAFKYRVQKYVRARKKAL